jgi:hypothetical protein
LVKYSLIKSKLTNNLMYDIYYTVKMTNDKWKKYYY